MQFEDEFENEEKNLSGDDFYNLGNDEYNNDDDFEELDYDEPKDEDFQANGKYYVLNGLKDYIDPHPSQEKLEWIVDKYNNGTEEERKEALTQMYGILCCYVWHYLNKYFQSYLKKYAEDLFSQAELGILDGMKNYDPRSSKPTTWFKHPIQHQILVYINEYIGHTTAHYTTAEKKIQALIKQKEKAGIEFTPRDIYIETGVPIKTIQNVMNARSVSVSSISAAEKDFDVKAANTTPEKDFLDKEHEEEIQNIIFGTSGPAPLTELEQKVVCCHFGFFEYEELNNKETAELLNISSGKVNSIYRDAMHKLEIRLKRKNGNRRKSDVKRNSKNKTIFGDKLSDSEMSEDMAMLLLEDDEEYIISE